MIAMTNFAPNVERGDVVLLPISFVGMAGSKVRLAVVIQNDTLNGKLNSTIVAIITSTTKRAATEPSQLFVDIDQSEASTTGLLHNSTVKCEHLDTVARTDIVRVIGHFPDDLMDRIERCIQSALALK